MPLEPPRKAVQTFSDTGSYPTTGDDVKRTSEAVIRNKPRIEKWTSSEGRTEIHYFRLEDDEYLFGYNPLLMSKEYVEKILCDIF